MAEAPTTLSNAEDFSHAILTVIEGPLETWESDARSEEGRIAASQQLEAWFTKHAHAKTPEARRLARDELQDVIELVSFAYHTRGRTASERIAEEKQREEFVALLSTTIDETLHGQHAQLSLNDIEQLSADVTKEASKGSLDTLQTSMTRILAFAGATVKHAQEHAQKGVETLHQWNNELEKRAPDIHNALQNSERILRDPLPHLRKQLDQTYQHVKTHQPAIANLVTHSPTLKLLTFAVMLQHGIGSYQKNRSQDRAAVGIEMTTAEKSGLWAPLYANYVQAHLNDTKGTHFDARNDDKGVLRVGFGTSMDSPMAKEIFHKAGVDYEAVRAGKKDVTQDQAIRLLHSRAEYFANARAEVTLNYADRVAVMNDTWGKEVMDDLKPWFREPEKFAFHEVKTEKKEAKKDTHMHVEKVAKVEKAKPQHQGKFAQRYSHKSERNAPTKEQKAAMADAGTKVITANVQLSPNPNAYMSKSLLEETVTALKDVPHERDFGNPKDPGSQKFYDAMMIALKGAEGFSDVMYYCSAHKPTIGYGCRLDLKENQRLIEDLFPGKYSIKSLMERTQRLDMEDARTLAHTMLAEKERDLMDRIDGYADIPEGHKASINDMYYNGGLGLVGKKLRRAYEDRNYDEALRITMEHSNGNDMKSLGDRRTFNVGMALLDPEVTAGSTQTARIVEQTVKLHVSSIKPRNIKELVVNLGVPKIDEMLESRLSKSNAIKEALRRGADVVIAADNDTLIAHADTRGKVEFKDYSHTDRLLAQETSTASKDGVER